MYVIKVVLLVLFLWVNAHVRRIPIDSASGKAAKMLTSGGYLQTVILNSIEGNVPLQCESSSLTMTDITIAPLICERMYS